MKEDDLDWTCSIHGGSNKSIRSVNRKSPRGQHFEDLGLTLECYGCCKCHDSNKYICAVCNYYLRNSPFWQRCNENCYWWNCNFTILEILLFFCFTDCAYIIFCSSRDNVETDRKEMVFESLEWIELNFYRVWWWNSVNTVPFIGLCSVEARISCAITN
jgi:hypothetical protein